ncbi:hypothetical protein ACRCPS_17375 [Pseudomonas aeruginosa]
MNTTPTDNEAFYDQVIAPELKRLGELCSDHKMSLLAVVQVGPDLFGRTANLQDDRSLAMSMLDLCARSGVNVDQYVFALLRHLKQCNMDTGASIVLRAIENLGQPAGAGAVAPTS